MDVNWLGTIHILRKQNIGWVNSENGNLPLMFNNQYTKSAYIVGGWEGQEESKNLLITYMNVPCHSVFSEV